jgi:hypothetical protein
MDEKDIIPFLRNYKKVTTERLKDIAEENHSYPPYIRNSLEIPKTLKEVPDEKVREARSWARCSVFQYKYFYNRKHGLLGVFGVPTCMRDQFDKTVYFQNSCDQDYKFERWKGVPIFEQIAEKWKNATDEEVYKTFEYPDEHDEPIDYDYYRRSNAYDEIWKMCETYLYNEDDVVYISMFGGYEIAEQKGFCKKCRDAYDEWRKGANNG